MREINSSKVPVIFYLTQMKNSFFVYWFVCLVFYDFFSFQQIQDSYLQQTELIRSFATAILFHSTEPK